MSKGTHSALQFGSAHELEVNLSLWPVVEYGENFRFSGRHLLGVSTQPCSSSVRDCPPGVAKAHQRHPLWKTKIWNRSDEKRSGVYQLTAAARVQDPCAIVWR